MADIIALRAQLEGDKAALAQAQQKLQLFEEELQNAEGGELPHPPLHEPTLTLQIFRTQVLTQAAIVRRIQGEVDAAQAAYTAAAQADPMHGTDAGLPLVLLPVRIETAFLSNASGGTDLAVRVYPDDIHVDSHEPELTAAELAAGTSILAGGLGSGFEFRSIEHGLERRAAEAETIARGMGGRRPDTIGSKTNRRDTAWAGPAHSAIAHSPDTSVHVHTRCANDSSARSLELHCLSGGKRTIQRGW